MDALRVTPTPAPLLRRHHSREMARCPVPPRPRIKPFVAAKLSKPPEAAHSSTASAVVVEDLSAVAPPRPRVSPESLQYPPGYVGAIPSRSGSETSEGVMGAMTYLTNILSSKVYDVAIESPLQLAPKLSDRLGVNVWLKREDLQPVFSFKLRGAYNMMAKLPSETLEKGVICSSAGNHAQGVALSAKRLNCSAVIAMPVTTPEIKWKSVEALGATVVLVGDSYDEAQAYAKKRGLEEGRTFIPPFDHPDVIMGQGTVGMEIVRQMPNELFAIFVPVGGGGLIAGIAAYVKRVSPEVKIIGVEPTDANAMALSLHHDQRVILDQVGGFADGVAVKEVGEETFRICKELIDGVVLVSRDSICASIKDMFEEKRNILEPAGALALAGAEAYCKYNGIQGKNIVVITSGANMNFDKLRVVTELANVGRKQEAVLATVMPEEPGSFKQFCQLVGKVNITEFKYRYNSNEKAVVLYSVGVHTVSELRAMQERMESCLLKTYNLTESDLVKDHLRYLMGGRSNVQNEVLCRFTFPERPGALMKFLDSFSPRWNISLFHYRGEGETGANVLVGIQVPKNDMDEFHGRANRLGYDYKVVNNDDDFQLLMH
ncbi:threonine dehydratase biosynthetic, chloroplastic [Cajanus cajan]|uniref:Threonine dehydratase n=1 Tax=Cajanus cajan TaxID=3821 RepID=A0A151U378_CAJCA|nr:threonine dehydratase biosynthetic, chloroplastic [Cajanus cajan]KYP73714.1 hypothetical protein KK1_006362 [Cajanus cajan]